MKINVEVDCTPQEARALLGLPDVSEANRQFVDNITDAMQSAKNPAQFQEFAQTLAPMGQMGLQMFQNFVDTGMRAPTGTGKSASAKPKDDE